MALVLADRVQETTTTSGTGTLTLGGAVSGYRSFGSGVGVGNTTYYCIYDQTAQVWEIGLGTVGSGTLARTTVYSNSSGNTSPLTLAGNTASVFAVYTASKTVNLDASGNVTPLGTIASGTWQGSTVGVAYGGTGVTTSSGANSVVLRDANSNINFNNFIAGASATTAAGTTTVLTASSSRTQILVGSTTQTFQLPNATTMSLGQSFIFVNNSSGTLTVKDNASTTVETVPSGGITQLGATSIATSAGTWGAYSFIPAAVDWGTNSLNLASTVVSGGTWNGGTIQPGYGGTGLTTFTAANYALYSSSASALTAGTLPVPAGGTGQVSFSSGYIPYGNTTAALQSSSLLQFNGSYLQVGGGSVLGGATNPIAAFTQSANNYVQTYTYNPNTGISASSDFVAYTNNSTDAHGWADMGFTSSTYADTVYTVTGPNEAYLFGSALNSTYTGNLVYATDSTGSANAHQWYVGGFTQAKSAYKMQLGTSGLDLKTTVLLNSSAGTSGQVLTSAGAGATPTWTTPTTGTVTSVTGTAPIVSSGGNTPAISITQATTSTNGYLSSTDWNTFNGKQAALVSGSNIKTVNGTSLLGSGDVGVGVTSVSGTAPISVATGTTTPAISISQATTSTNGYLSSTDWNTFNNKLSTAVTSATASTGISVSASTGAVTFTNTGVTSAAAGTGISVSASTGGVTFTNTGVTSLAAGNGISVSGSTGGVTITATGATLNSQAGAYVLVASDAGKIVSNTTGGITVNNSVFSAGNIVTIYNNSASSQTITQGTGVTLQWAGQSSSTTGNRTLGLYGIATIVFLSASSAVITGSGLT